MSLLGPKKDIRALLRPMLDAIAPDSATNLLELAANKRERALNPALPVVAPMGWQNNFFQTKICSPLTEHAIKLSGAWEDDTSQAKQIIDILGYLDVENPEDNDFTKYIKALLAQAPGYIDELHISVQSQFDSPESLDCDPLKALYAFERMVRCVLAFNAHEMLDLNKLDADQQAQVLTKVKERGYQFNSLNEVKAELERLITSLAVFSTQEKIDFRIMKAAKNHALLNGFFEGDFHAHYYGGRRFDQEAQKVELAAQGFSAYPATLWQGLSGLAQMGKSITTKAALFPLVKFQQARHYAQLWLGFKTLDAQAKYFDVPVVGRALGLAKKLLPYADIVGLGTYELYQLFLADEKTKVELLNVLSPFAKYIALAALGIIGAYAVKESVQPTVEMVGAIKRYNVLSKDMVEAIVQENMAAFKAWLTPEILAECGIKVLKEPIVLPRSAVTILSLADQNKIYEQIAQLRWHHCKEHFPQLAKPQIFVLANDQEPHVGTPHYLPSRGHKVAGMEELCQALDDLDLAQDFDRHRLH